MKFFVLALCIHFIKGQVAFDVIGSGATEDEGIPLKAQLLSGEELVEYLQENQNLFEAGITPVSYDIEHRIMDLSFIGENREPIVGDENDEGDDIPESFDARTHWPNCSSLTHIRDQANCGSCWAVSTAAALSDRICISTNGTKQVNISATDILTCCYKCGYGCQGGWPIEAWEYVAREGAVTGGDFLAKSCCRSYPFPPCGHHGNETYYGECGGRARTPKCRTSCTPGYKNSYSDDKIRGKDAYELPNSVKAIQREIMKNGPVVAAFTVYADFSYYKKGIYKHTAGRARGSHAVKVIGWGEEGDVPYWIIANSWHNDWGEEGYFRMIRGTNHCGIEGHMVAGHV
uniref:Cysteine protease n=2 Tax=Haemonchus contortus TaxID=6289 RepID=A0A7I4XTY3_HAECO|nr:Peptidase C1A domain containing protein [Haemonchus contortus]